jgi:hypothetical protein
VLGRGRENLKAQADPPNNRTVIRPVDASLAAETGQPTQATSATKPTDASFAATLKKEAAKTAQRIVPPAGETWKPVKGEDGYVEIVSGPRKGQYVDIAKGDNRGETFTIQQREGKLVRVYGEGETEKVVAIKDDGKDSSKQPHSAKEVKPPKGELWAPVEGHWNYADILNGKRNGFFVNLSSGARRGMTFLIEHHNGKTYHVYGEGKHRQMVEVRTKADAKTGGTSATSSQGTSQPTSG